MPSKRKRERQRMEQRRAMNRHKMPHVNGQVPLLGQGHQQRQQVHAVQHHEHDGPLVDPHLLAEQVARSEDGRNILVRHFRGGQTKMEAATVALAAALLQSNPGLHNQDDELETTAANLARRCLDKARELDPHFAVDEGTDDERREPGSDAERADGRSDPADEA